MPRPNTIINAISAESLGLNDGRAPFRRKAMYRSSTSNMKEHALKVTAEFIGELMDEMYAEFGLLPRPDKASNTDELDPAEWLLSLDSGRPSEMVVLGWNKSSEAELCIECSLSKMVADLIRSLAGGGDDSADLFVRAAVELERMAKLLRDAASGEARRA